MRRSVPEGVVLAVAAIVLVVALVFVATRSPSKTDSTSAVSTATPASSATRAPSPAPSASSKPQAASSAAPTRAPVTAATAAPRARAAGAATPPKPGRYVYTETDSEGTRSSTLDIASHGDGKETENNDSGSTIDEIDWRPDGKYDLATTFSLQGGSFRCDWSPDFTQYRFPLRRGSSWTVHTSCHPNAQTTITLSGSSRVSAEQRATVGGTPVDTWIILTDATITFSGNGASFSETIQDEDHFAPDYGITVHEVQNTTDTDPSGQQTRDKTTRDLRSLKPTTQV